MNEQQITITVNVAETNVLLSGLAELPAKNSYDLINKVKAQAEQQIAAQQPKQELLTEGAANGNKS